MRRILRLLRFFGSVLGYTSHLWWTVRRVPVPERPAYRALRQMYASRAFCRIMGIEVTLQGRVPEGGAFLVVSNHLCFFDPFLLAAFIPVSFAGKAELKHWPVVGWVCRTAGLIFVERERRMQTGQFVQAIREKLDHGVEVLVFPEGTTSDGTSVKPFKTGGFAALAGYSGGAVLPLYMDLHRIEGRPVDAASRRRYTWSAEDPQTFLQHVWRYLGVRRAQIHLRVGRPIATEGRDRKALAALAQREVEALAGMEPAAGASSAELEQGEARR
jgi:1-acyl-sn-glycerol-3-phosphate acyltransferase